MWSLIPNSYGTTRALELEIIGHRLIDVDTKCQYAIDKVPQQPVGQLWGWVRHPNQHDRLQHVVWQLRSEVTRQHRSMGDHGRHICYLYPVHSHLQAIRQERQVQGWTSFIESPHWNIMGTGLNILPYRFWLGIDVTFIGKSRHYI